MCYSCVNCSNLKEKTITREDLKQFSKYKILKAIRQHNLLALGIQFPMNVNVYKRLRWQRICEIVYCSENLLRRDLYIRRDNFDPKKIYPCAGKPCPRYI